MGAKTFINKSGAPLSILLNVRQGDTPGTSAGSQIVALAAGASVNYTYSPGSANPYLDGVIATASANGAIVGLQETVTTRGSQVDSALNTNNTVTFAMAGTCLTATYSNH